MKGTVTGAILGGVTSRKDAFVDFAKEIDLSLHLPKFYSCLKGMQFHIKTNGIYKEFCLSRNQCLSPLSLSKCK